jgi:ribosomal protein S18 acetylase RimI-like enzyme
MRLRAAVLADAPELAMLSTELGYPVDAATVRRRLAGLVSRSDQTVVVACDEDGAVIGWIHGATQALVEVDERCEILGLIVSSRHRRQGIGEQLVASVETWACERGFAEMSVRSNVVRVESHPFYEKRGYVRVKTQHAYRKRIND